MSAISKKLLHTAHLYNIKKSGEKMVDYSNTAFVKARNAAARKEIESSERNFETFAATNLTDA